MSAAVAAGAMGMLLGVWLVEKVRVVVCRGKPFPWKLKGRKFSASGEPMPRSATDSSSDSDM